MWWKCWEFPRSCFLRCSLLGTGSYEKRHFIFQVSDILAYIRSHYENVSQTEVFAMLSPQEAVPPRGWALRAGAISTLFESEPEIEEVCGHTEVTSASLRCTSHQRGVMGKWPHHSITWCTSRFCQRYIKRRGYSCIHSGPTLHQSKSTLAPVCQGL